MDKSLIFHVLLFVCIGLNFSSVFGQESDAEVYHASTCEELRDIIRNNTFRKHIFISSNLGCTRTNWPQPLFVTNDTWIEGRKYSRGIPAIDWSDLRNSLVLQSQISLSFINVLLLQDFAPVGSLRLSFVTGYTNAQVRLLGVGVGIRSCAQNLGSLVSVFERISRPNGLTGTQSVSGIDTNALFAENIAFLPRIGDNSTWAICRSMYQCNVNSPEQRHFQENLYRQRMDPTCSDTLVTTTEGSTSTGDSESSNRNGTFAAIVSVVTAILTALVLIAIYLTFKFLVIPLFKKRESPKPKKEDAAANEDDLNNVPVGNVRKSRSRQISSESLLITAIQLTDIELGVPLGRGDLSTVYKGYYKDDPLAVKVVDVEASECVIEDDDPVAVYFAQRMFDFNVVKTLLYQTHRVDELYGTGTIRDSDNGRGRNPVDTLSSINEIGPTEVFQYRTFHVMEFCNLGNLEKAISDGVFHEPDGAPKLISILRSALDVAKGMKYLHSMKIIHGQLRPTNILRKGDALDARGFICKITDFGIPHWRQTQQALEVTSGVHLAYRAPEALRRGTVEYGSDVYSFGMLLWTMLSGTLPFSGFDAAETSSSILEGVRPEIPPCSSRAYDRLIKDCWHSEVSARPPFSNIIERLGKIITEVVRAQDGLGENSHHRRGVYSSSDADTLVYGGSIGTENALDTMEIHETSSGYRSDSVSPTPSNPFWEQFQSSTSPMSTKSDNVFPSFDPVQSEVPKRPCNSWDERDTMTSLSEQQQRSNRVGVVVASKPSETVSLRFGIGTVDRGSSGSSNSTSNLPSVVQNKMQVKKPNSNDHDLQSQ
eukprot:g5719.t1